VIDTIGMATGDCYKVIESNTDRVLYYFIRKSDATYMALQMYLATGKRVYVVDTKGNEIYSKR